MKKTTLLIIAFSILGLVACKKETNDVDFGFDYFPLEEGHFVEYEVMEIFHDKDLIPQHDTVRYKLRTVIGEDVLDNLGRNAKKFFRYAYSLDSGELIDQRVWATIIDENKRGEVVEENQRKIRLVFAVKDNKEWNVNAFNTEEDNTVYFANVNTPKTINGFHFEETAKVVYGDLLSLVDYRKMHEVYAKGVGLVERSFKDLTIQNFDTTQINKGTEVHYKLLDYGME